MTIKKALKILLWSASIGLIASFLRIAYGATLASLSIWSITVITGIDFIKPLLKKEPFNDEKLFKFAMSIWFLYFMSRIRFWDMAITLAYLSIFISIFTVIIFSLSNRFVSKKPIFLTIIICIGIFSTFIHNYSIYPYTNYTWYASNAVDSSEYNRYSYFLFLGGKTKEGIEAGEKAIKCSIDEHGINSAETKMYIENLDNRKKYYVNSNGQE